MKVLIASTPATGHINPMFSLGRILVDAGHQVVGMSAIAMRDRIEGSGATFRPFPPGADLDFRDVDATFPERKNIPIGPQQMLFNLERAFIEPLTAQHEGMKAVLDDFPADIIIGDNLLLGVLPMLLGPRSDRPPIILCGTSFLHCRRDDGAPHFVGLPPASNDAEREEYAATAKAHDEAVYNPASRTLDKVLAKLATGPLRTPMIDAMVTLPDRFLQLSVPSFEFPRREMPANVRFVGTLPIIPNQAPIPWWAGDLNGSRRVVLVTQGTVSNHDFRHLLGPTLETLANDKDLLVVATAGGRGIDKIPGPIPSNARVASYLPFEWMLPKIDALVTNGGYGSVNQALSFGVPLVTAGKGEDKPDVNARVAWSGVGIDLATNEPTPEALRTAIRAVLDKPIYRMRAAAMAKEFARIDTRSEILRIVSEIARDSAGDSARQRDASERLWRRRAARH
jgi:UDP:flavonoid glycosyltransferase YjiC (YdhE family)